MDFQFLASKLIISDFIYETSASFYSCCFYVTQIDLSLEADSKVFNLIISAQHISAIYLITSNWLTTALTLCNVMFIKNKDLLGYSFTSEF